jgi:tetratricopeptide (TPR) repeat protein
MYKQFDLFSDWDGTLDRLAVMLGGHSLSGVVPAAPVAPEQRRIDRLHGKAAAFFFAGDFRRAFDTWNEVEALGDRSAISLMNKGLTLFQTDRLDEAIAAFDEALSIDAEFYPAWANKGAALAKAGRSSEAIEAYGKALEIKPRAGAAALGDWRELGCPGPRPRSACASEPRRRSCARVRRSLVRQRCRAPALG